MSFPKSALVAAAILGVITLEESSGRQQLPRPQRRPGSYDLFSSVCY